MTHGQDVSLIKDDTLAQHRRGCCDAERSEALGGNDEPGLVARSIGDGGEFFR